MSQNSKLSEALAATLLRFKEIDRDTIEALCKRAASLEHQVTQNTADINRETTLRSVLQDTKDQLADWQKAEQAISSSYLKIRGILGANSSAWMEPNPAEPQIQRLFEYTENVAEQLVKSHNQLQWALRDLLAQTRDLDDRGPEGEGYQSDALQNAIATADALVGTDVTEQFPIADEPLNRRIQELEVALAEEKKKKQGNVFIGKDMLNIEQDGVTRVRAGSLEVDRKWSEEALRLLIKNVMAEREAEIADKFQETQAQLDHMSDKMAAALRKSSTESTTVSVEVTGPDSQRNAAIRNIIDAELKPGGSIHAAIRQLGGNLR